MIITCKKITVRTARHKERSRDPPRTHRAIITIIYTETKMSSSWRNFHHWLHWKLSFWQLPVQSVMKISSKWQHFCFSVWRLTETESSPPQGYSRHWLHRKLSKWQLLMQPATTTSPQRRPRSSAVWQGDTQINRVDVTDKHERPLQSKEAYKCSVRVREALQ